ncbi:hypothetical protein EC912_10832 [Luteibacter rhizovicinus]|uniref:Secreted protein n=1 Tax=Luteibacter rhizovicinus TaxID=242606 RepID=A0A4R3YIV0_9GAMM|nr:hypothetical protein [Luteibacter rhizovicinus]TCV92041.1 hypothetical protein EC912_10832 [Luteibacter rhizovicinus]
MIKRMTGLAVLALAAAGMFSAQPARADDANLKCHMTFNLKGWSAIYKHAEGAGTVRCENGQKANVKIEINGAGLSAGKWRINDGKGDITHVKTIDDVFGDYAMANADAGVVKSAGASILTKGTVSLALAGTGEGINLGIDVSGFKITRVK